MIEIRTFEGDAHALSDFTMSVWRKSYAGKMAIPLWSPQYFRRELFAAADGREFLVAAYDGTRLVGSHPMHPLRVQLHGNEHRASWGSYLTVEPDYRRQGVAKLMQEEQERRHVRCGAVADFGFLYVRTARSLGKKFWLQAPAGTAPLRHLGTWGRAIDHRAVAAFEYYRSESLGARFLGLFQAVNEPRDMSGVRAYRTSDLAACAALVRARSAACDLGYLWTEDELARYFDYEDLSSTLVMELQGRVAGLVNYFRLGFLGRREMRVGVIDFIACDGLAHRERVRLLQAVLWRMKQEGLAATMFLRGSWHAARALWAAGFFPLPPEYIYVGTSMSPALQWGNVRSVHAVWR